MRKLAALAAVASLVLVPGATAKEFDPGDLRLCGAKRCVTVTNRTLLDRLSALVYTGGKPARAHPVALGAPYYELRFRNGYVAGVLATRRLDRWLSYGVVLERFERGQWYVVPASTSAALRRGVVGLAPLRLTRTAVARSR